MLSLHGQVRLVPDFCHSLQHPYTTWGLQGGGWAGGGRGEVCTMCVDSWHVSLVTLTGWFESTHLGPGAGGGGGQGVRVSWGGGGAE